LKLEEMYQQPFHEHSDFVAYLDSQIEVQAEHNSSDYKQVVAYCKNIGEGLRVQTGGVNQECERELEEELEEEDEQEVEIIEKTPFSQIRWNFSLSMGTGYVRLFDSEFLPLQKFVAERLPDLKQIQWSKDLYITRNFWKTIQDSLSSTDMSLFLRLVNAMLVFRDGRVVLVSLFELDQLLPYWWRSANSPTRPPCYIEQLSRVFHTGQTRFGYAEDTIPVEVLTSIKLFCGMVDYSQEEKKILKRMLQDLLKPRLTIEKLLMKRQKLWYFERSDLEAFCDTMG
ncbi:MAG: hypothetical protein SGILL_010573, partial [Bacillariaceae sp.]